MLRSFAHSKSMTSLQNVIQFLKASDIFRNNLKVQNWMNKYWLPQIKRWAQVYRNNDTDLVINTNNGIERQNKVLK